MRKLNLFFKRGGPQKKSTKVVFVSQKKEIERRQSPNVLGKKRKGEKKEMSTIYANKKGNKIVSFKLRAFLGRDESGKQLFKFKTWKVPEGMTEKKAYKEAQKEADAFEKDLLIKKKNNEILFDKSKITISVFIEKYIYPEIKKTCKPTTIEFKEMFFQQIIDLMGNEILSNINAVKIKQYIKKWEERFEKRNNKMPSAQTKRHLIVQLNSIFKTAKKERIIEYNPVLEIETPSVKRKQVDALNKTESIDFVRFAGTKEPRLELMYYILITCGLRRGELFGLTWDCIDFKEKLLTVKQNVTYADHQVNIGTVKTPTGEYRKIPLTDPLIKLLQEFKASEFQDRKFNKKAFLFHTEGDYLFPQNPTYITKRMKKDIKKLDISDVSPHDLRHTAATLLLHSGADVKTVQDILGHADSSTTLNYYVKGDINKMREATNNAFNFKTDYKGE